MQLIILLPRPRLLMALFCFCLGYLLLTPVDCTADSISYAEASITEWADEVISYTAGSDVDATWQDSSQALGPAGISLESVVSLGEGGSITLSFPSGISNGDGWDFAVFENAFSPTFLELAWVEVSSDGINYVRFPNFSHTPSPVPAYGQIDPDGIDGYAGQHAFGLGTPFDLEDLTDLLVSDLLDFNAINYVRLVDVVGDGNALDSSGNIIFDPYPTYGSAGFDLDGVAVHHIARPIENTGSINLGISVAANRILLSWNSQPEKVYEIHYSTDLLSWGKLEQVTATQDVTVWSEDLNVETTGFFRIVQVEN